MEEPCFSEGFRGPPDRLPEKESEGGGDLGSSHPFVCNFEAPHYCCIKERGEEQENRAKKMY